MRDIKYLVSLFLFLFLAGCTTVSMLEHIPRGEGRHVLFDVSQEKLGDLAVKAFESTGISVERVNYKSDRTEILGYQPEELGENGAVYGLYIYPLTETSSEIYFVRKARYPSEAFSRDATEDVLNRLDELVVGDSN